MLKFIKENMVMIIFTLTSLINSFLLVNMTCGIYNIRFLICDLFILLFICSFSFLIKNKNLYFLIFSIILTSICTINSFYYNEFNDFNSIYLFETLFQALALPSAAITNVFEFKDFIFIFQVIIMLVVIIIFKNDKNKSVIKFKNTLVLSFSILVIILLNFSSNDIYKFKNTWNNVYQVRNFGVYSYQLKDIGETIALLFDDIGKNKASEEVLSFYSSKEDSKDNEYTNIFKDKMLF